MMSNHKLLNQIFVVILIAKIVYVFTVLIGHGQLYLGNNDANYYHSFAIGDIGNAVNSWPLMLRVLENFGLYDRVTLTIVNVILVSTVIPVMVGFLCCGRGQDAKYISDNPSLVFWGSACVVSLYPSLFYYSLDVNREPLMVFLFLLALFLMRGHLSANSKYITAIKFLMLAPIIVILYSLREYLGASLGLAVVASRVFNLSFKGSNIILVFVLYGILLTLFSYFGFFDSLLDYRGRFFDARGGASFDQLFDSKSMIVFELLFSFFYQFIGIYFVNSFAVVVFLMEGVPCALSLLVIIKYRMYLDRFSKSLLYFVMIYSSVLLIGNGNLGTSIRLRIFSYLSILIVTIAVYHSARYHARLRGSTS